MTLAPNHAASLEASGIAPEVIERRGYRTVTDAAELAALGFASYQCNVPALLVPGYGPDGKNGRYQIRPDRPRITATGKNAPKYESAAGVSPWLDTPPSMAEQVRDVGVPLWVTEGTKKADSMASIGLPCIALQGVWNWLGGALGDWSHIPLKHRAVNIAYDSDAATNENVRLAERRLAAFLESLGARVRIRRLPPAAGKKQGLDDFIAAGHTAAVLDALPDAPLEETDDTEVARLRERANVLQAQLDVARRDLAREQERNNLLRRALRNPEIREEVPTALALVEITTTRAGDPASAVGWQKVYRPKVAELANLSAPTVSRHFKRLDALGVMDRKWSKRANGKGQLWARSDPEIDVLRRLAFAEPLEDAPTVATGRRRDWGKFRWQCREHPSAGIRIRVIRQCAECGALAERVPVPDDEPGGDQLDRVGAEGMGDGAEAGAGQQAHGDQVDPVIHREGDQVDPVGGRMWEEIAEIIDPPPTATPKAKGAAMFAAEDGSCVECRRRPVVPYHPRCQPCINLQLERRKQQQRGDSGDPPLDSSP